MNNVDTPEQVLNLVDEDYELNHPSRKWIGWHLFLSRFFHHFEELDLDHQIERLKSIGYRWDASGKPYIINDVDETTVRNVNLVSDDDEINSIDDISSIDTIKIHLGCMIRLSGTIWRRYMKSIHDAWNSCAERLNERPIPGLFIDLPDVLKDNLIKKIFNTLYEAWLQTVKQMKLSVYKRHSGAKTNHKLHFIKTR